MQVSTGKLQVLTVAAMLLVISGGIAAYANGQNVALDAVTSSSSSSSSSSTSSSSSSSSSTSTATSAITTTSTPGPLCTSPTAQKEGRLVLPIGPSSAQASGSIMFGDGNACYASIQTAGGVFSVNVVLRYAKPLTQYNLVLVANGTSYVLGNMVTGPSGSGEASNQVLLKTGTYAVSLQIFDTSSTPGQSVLVLQSATGTLMSAAFPAPPPQTTQKGESGEDGGKS